MKGKNRKSKKRCIEISQHMVGYDAITKKPSNPTGLITVAEKRMFISF